MGRKKMLKEEKKVNLTINVNETLLDRLDEKGEKRSRLIERLIEEYVNNKTDIK